MYFIEWEGIGIREKRKDVISHPSLMGQVYGPIFHGPNREGKIILIFLCKDKIKYYPTLEEQYKTVEWIQ